MTPKKRLLAANWIDLELGETDEDRRSAEAELRGAGLPESFVESALANGALPKFESNGSSHILLIRAFDEAADRRAENTRALTRKLAVLITGDRVYSVHRFPTPEIPEIFAPQTGSTRDLTHPLAPEKVLELMIERAARTYSDALALTENAIDEIEAGIFKATSSKSFRLQNAYILKRRLSVQKKMLELNREAITEAGQAFPSLALSALKRKAVRLIALADALLENLNQLLQLQLAIVSQKTNEASQRTNEVMRVLTVFSAFFLPLSFVAGVYGMNFEGMPELRHPYGYPSAIALMAGVALTIFIWFRKRGWIGKQR